MKKGIVVLSLFDGMSCGMIALERAGIKVKKYYASEIDKYAQIVSEKNYPDIIRLGDITKWKEWKIEKPDIIIGGSPCQGFSFAGKGLNFDDPRSKLFFTFVDILKYCKPKYFLLENVRMKKEYQKVISDYLGVEPIEINSALVSAQNRRRLYWTNIQSITQPKDKGILLKDIIENASADKDKSYCLDASYYKGCSKEYEGKSPTLRGLSRSNNIPKTEQKLEINETGKSNALTSVSKDSLCIEIGKANVSGHDSNKRVYSVEGKSPCLNTCQGGNLEPKIAIKDSIYNNRAERIYNEKSPILRSERFGLDATTDNITWRKLTPIECERLQTVPDNYTNHVSNSQRYKMLGNGWTVDVIAHIFRGLK